MPYADIAEVVAKYVTGMCKSDAQLMREALHEDMCSIGHWQGGLEWDKRETFIAVVAKAVEVPDPNPWHRINAISVIGDVAVVQVENIWLGQHFDDVLTLLRHEDRWQIVSKAFYARP